MATQVSDAGSKTRLRGGSSDELAVIAQRAQSFTNASGTAIALGEGSADEIVCRARSGSSAPEVGTSLRVQGTFTGLCIQSGKELRCDDAETDTRVDTAAIRALGIRSMVVVPIKEDGRVVGVLAAFAPTAHAFTITHVAVLKTMGDQIAALLQKERKARDEGFSPEPPRAAPVAPVKPLSTPVAVTPAPVVVKPAALAPAPRPQLPVVPRVEPVRPSVVSVAEEVGQAPSPKKKKAEAPQEQTEPKTDYRINLGTLDAAAAQSGNRNLMLGIATVAVVAIVGGLSYFLMHKPAAQRPAQQAANAPAAVAPQPAALAPSNSSSSSSAAATAPAASVSQPPVSTDDSGKKANKSAAKSAPPAPQPKHEEPQQAKHEEPQPKHEETVALSARPSRIAGPQDNTAAAVPEAAPSMALGDAPASGALSSLASPVSASTPSMITQSDLQPISVIKRVPPVYPLVAKQRMLSGTVVVQGTVDTQGRIKNLQLISGSPIFRDAAFDAVKQWEFKPAHLNGQPIEQPTKIRLDFNPR
ncbi:MAG TPA: TonB family protein [Candidatus Angelobacter sp.]|nr:TonB family protein [Candidatus Angelobacter sp.]